MSKSNIVTGFHRLGVVLFVSATVFAGYLAWHELREPSGRPFMILPNGVFAPEKLTIDANQIVQALIAEQIAEGIVAPKGIVVVGIPEGTVRQNDIEWTKLLLRDGRQIGIASVDSKVTSDAAYQFLFREKAQGRPFTDKDNIYIGDTRIAFLNPYDQFPLASPPWPSQATHDWTSALTVEGIAVALYVVARALGWVLDGFFVRRGAPRS